MPANAVVRHIVTFGRVLREVGVEVGPGRVADAPRRREGHDAVLRDRRHVDVVPELGIRGGARDLDVLRERVVAVGRQVRRVVLPVVAVLAEAEDVVVDPGLGRRERAVPVLVVVRDVLRADGVVDGCDRKHAQDHRDDHDRGEREATLVAGRAGGADAERRVHQLLES